MRRFAYLTGLIGVSTAALGQTFTDEDMLVVEETTTLVEKWNCYDTWDLGLSEVLLVAERRRLEDGLEAGTITAAGRVNIASFEVEGIKRRWDFGMDDDGYSKYTFVIELDGTGLYYDFTRVDVGESTDPSARFNCNQAHVSEEESNRTRMQEDMRLQADATMPRYSVDDNPEPLVRVAPVYPGRALSRGLEGYVDLEFTVTTEGTVRDPVVIFSTSPLFERAATTALLRFKYRPQVVDGEVVEMPGIQTRITFRLED